MSDTSNRGIAVITGGSSGIGRATARLLADRRWTGVAQQQTHDTAARQRHRPALQTPTWGPQPARVRWGGGERSPALWLSRRRAPVLAVIGLRGRAAGQRLFRSR